jgi:fumarate reductase subunit C
MSFYEATLAARRPARSAALLDLVQMATGVALILFMWAHMLLVASVIIGPGVMDAIAGFFEATLLAQVGGPLIGLVFLLHFVLAARKMPFRAAEQKEIWNHSRQMRHTDTWLWVLQAGSAMVILILGSIHIFGVLTDLPITAAKSAARIQGGWWLLLYLVLLPLIELHVSVGFYRIGVKWGLIRRDNRKKLKGFENGLTLVFIVIGLLALLRFLFLAVPAGA